MSFPFIGFSYRDGLSALGQGLGRINEGFARAEEREEREKDRKLLIAAFSGDPQAMALAAAAQPALAARQAETTRQNAAGQRGLAALGQALGMPGASPPTSPGSASSGLSVKPPEGVTPDEDLAIRMTMAEAMGEKPEGWKAVAGVMTNRAKGAGQSLSDIIRAPGQFEPWASRRSELQGYDPNSEKYRLVANAVLPILRGQEPDPTGGATHFYAPKAQSQLGRRPPSWDDGSGVDIGNHRFFRLGYGGTGAGNPHGIRTGGTGGAPAQPVRVAGPAGVVPMAIGPGPTGLPDMSASRAALAAPRRDGVTPLTVGPDGGGVPAGAAPQGAPQLNSWSQEMLAEALRANPDKPVNQAIGAKEWDDYRPFFTGPNGQPLTVRDAVARMQGGGAGAPAQQSVAAPARPVYGMNPDAPPLPPRRPAELGGQPAPAVPANDPAAVDAAEAAAQNRPRQVLSPQFPAVQPGGTPASAQAIASAGTSPAPLQAPPGSNARIMPPQDAPQEPSSADRASAPAAPLPRQALGALPSGASPVEADDVPRRAPAAAQPAAEAPIPLQTLPTGQGRYGLPSWQTPADIPQPVQDRFAAARKSDIPRLTMIAANPANPESVREIAKMHLARVLNEDDKLTPEVREFKWAQANGQTTARTYHEWLNIKRREADPGAKVSSEVAAREAEARRLGMDISANDVRRYILTGTMPAEEKPDRKAITDADTAISSAQEAIGSLREAKRLSATAYDGLGADLRGATTATFGNPRGEATMALNNVVQTGALASLKSIFGGNPTEGERKILLEVSGSANQPRAVRDAIFDRALAAAERRLKGAQARAEELRGGTYYRPGGGQSGAQGRGPEARAPGDGAKPPAAARYDELVAQGLSKADAYARMAQEGY